MQIAVISDLHLGAKDRLDRFHRYPDAEAELMASLGRLERAVDRVVLCGDIFETLRGPRPGPMQAQLQAALDAYPELARRIVHDERYRIVPGNHDTLTEARFEAPQMHWEADHGLRIVFFHGHQSDRLARGRAPMSRLGVWAGGVLERMGVPVTQRVDAQRGRAYPEPDAPGLDPRRLELVSVATGRGLGADVVVNGHTHDAVHREVGDTVYLNSGTWLNGRREAVLIDTEARRFEILRDP